VSFLEERFPETVSFGFSGGPEFQTVIVTVDSGQEYPDQRWAQARRTYEASYAARLPAQYQPLQAFFHVAAGKANSFRVKDWTDFRHNDAGGTGVFSMLTATTFQMVKRYTSGSSTYDRIIQKQVSPIVVTGGTTPVVDYTTGIVTVAAGTPTVWTGTFDVPCRFDTDQMKGEVIDKSGKDLIIGWSSIPIIEIRV
jgi:uncharacterized protein (TIGR02217 family)